jgi:hypothetical protein
MKGKQATRLVSGGREEIKEKNEERWKKKGNSLPRSLPSPSLLNPPISLPLSLNQKKARAS